jgi:NAD(P)-dependent dehydrogenase (short-subunit alcohol dehydrogenase family)
MAAPGESSSTDARPLEGKVAIVTGASSGIGAASARAFASAGARVVLAARRADALQSVADDIAASGGEALAVPCDVTDPAAVEALVRRTVETYGRLDAAFNNAGAGHMPRPLADLAVEDFEANVRVNLTATFLCMKWEIPAMLASGGGAIVNMASLAGLRGWYGIGAYSAAKHGIVGLSMSTALDYAAQGVRVNVVAPGPILAGGLALQPEAIQAQAAGAVPMRRVGAPEEVAAAAVWLCSEAASFVTGVVLPVDGGQSASG